MICRPSNHTMHEAEEEAAAVVEAVEEEAEEAEEEVEAIEAAEVVVVVAEADVNIVDRMIIPHSLKKKKTDIFESFCGIQAHASFVFFF